MLISKLKEKNIPFISAMGAALKTDPSLIKITTMNKTINCPLACFVRKRLRRQNVPLNFKVVYSSEVIAPDMHLDPPTENQTGSGRQRHKMGSLPTITGIFGLLCAQEAISFLTQKN